MSAVLLLAALGALAGLASGFFGLWWGVLAISGLVIAIVGAIVLQNENFGFFAGVATIVIYLAINQITYIIGLVLATRGSDPEGASPRNEADGHPGSNSEKEIDSEHQEYERKPPRADPPNN